MKRGASFVAILAVRAIAAAADGGCICHRETRIPSSGVADHVAGEISAVVQLAPAERHQVLEGFGASLAWHLEKVAGKSTSGDLRPHFPRAGARYPAVAQSLPTKQRRERRSLALLDLIGTGRASRVWQVVPGGAGNPLTLPPRSVAIPVLWRAAAPP
jgi:hypothetical protein